jgi:hypothetical protein
MCFLSVWLSFFWQVSECYLQLDVTCSFVVLLAFSKNLYESVVLMVLLSISNLIHTQQDEHFQSFIK